MHTHSCDNSRTFWLQSIWWLILGMWWGPPRLPEGVSLQERLGLGWGWVFCSHPSSVTSVCVMQRCAGWGFFCIFWRQRCCRWDLAWEFVFPHQWGWAGSCLVVGLSEVNLGSETGLEEYMRGVENLVLNTTSGWLWLSVTSSPQNVWEWEQRAKLQGFAVQHGLLSTVFCIWGPQGLGACSWNVFGACKRQTFLLMGNTSYK